MQVKKEINPIALEIDPCAIAFTRGLSGGLSGASNSGRCSTGSIKSHIFFHGTWWYFEGKVYDTTCQVGTFLFITPQKLLGLS